MQHESKWTIGKYLLALTSMGALAVATIPCAHARTFNVVHNFTGGNDGGNPVSGFMMNAKGMLFGTATTGGNSGLGVVYKVGGKGVVTVLHSFTGGSDGATPNGGVIEDASGALYGTTTAGGASGAGTVFRMNGTNETVLYSFGGGGDGADPQAGLVMDAAGNLYGTTSAGGSAGNGTVFEVVAPTDGKGSILHSFQNKNDGSTPYAGLVSDAAGNFYGATTDGGVKGGGTIFELAPSGGSWTFSVLKSLPGWGISGPFRDLVLDASGNIYGTTHCDGAHRAGTIFELKPSNGSWTYTLLYTFTGGNDGEYSISNLVLKRGSLYGTTIEGGTNGAGVVYKLIL